MGACESLRLSNCVLVQPDGWARGEREGYGGPRDVTSLSLTKAPVPLVLAPSQVLERDRADKESQNLTYEVRRRCRHEQADGRVPRRVRLRLVHGADPVAPAGEVPREPAARHGVPLKASF